MLTVERMDDYLRVTGYPDGSDWIFRPPRPPERGHGMAGDAHAWYCDRGGTLQILDAHTRRPSAAIQLGDMKASAAPSVSRDGRKLYALTHAGQSETASS
jgi:hypothetical protein